MKLFRKIKKSFESKNNTPECIYGPPEMLEARRYGRKTDTGNDTFIVEDNDPVDIYGPPEMLGAMEYEEDADPEESGDEK